MDTVKQAAAIEAILFTMGETVAIERLAEALEETAEEARAQIDFLKEKYEREESGIGLIELEGAVQLCTKKEFYPALIRIAKTPKKPQMTDALLETLSIVAYKQPVTRLDVERIRGVNSDHSISRLAELGLITELGRLSEAPGKPILFGTTEEFLRSFGVRSLEELPSLDAVKVEEFKQEAEHEVGVRLNV